MVWCGRRAYFVRSLRLSSSSLLDFGQASGPTLGDMVGMTKRKNVVERGNEASVPCVSLQVEKGMIGQR